MDLNKIPSCIFHSVGEKKVYNINVVKVFGEAWDMILFLTLQELKIYPLKSSMH